MRSWNLSKGDPYTLPLAADQRLTRTDYTNDHIWELLLGTGDPAAILLQTSFGLRARNLRIFPRFIEDDSTVTSPASFETSFAIKKFHPNYCLLTFSPFAGINITSEYWVPDSHTIAGRVKIANSGVTARKIRLEMVSLLHPAGKDREAMLPVKKEAVTILQGHTENLFPVLFLTGGARGFTSPYTALIHELDLLPGGARQFTWVLASLPDPDSSFTHARRVATRNWEAEIARIEMTNAGQVEIHTGNPDWDAAFSFAQQGAYSALHSPTDHLPFPSLVTNRRPDQGHSPRGDGSDYNHLWSGQTALEAWYLTGLLLPGEPEIAIGLLKNFFPDRETDSAADWKPGLAGQRARMLATPVLAGIAWKIYEYTEDEAFLEEVFSPLLNFVQQWFYDRQDRDGDGIPEWDNSLQTGFDANPAFSRWHNWSQAADIRFVESPDLCAFLYRECRLLIRMAKIIKREETILPLEALSQNLASALEAAWDGRRATYHYWDRETHQSPKGEVLKERLGNGQLFLDIVFEYPRRIMLRFETGSDIIPQAEAVVHGVLPGGQHRVERVGKNKFTWIEGLGTATLEQVFAEIEHIQIEGMPDDGKSSVQLINFHSQDHTLLLPLWAEIPDAERAAKIIQRKLSKPTQYQRAYGIPAALNPPNDPAADVCAAVWLPWNVMIGEGFLKYGERAQAVKLVSRIMEAIAENLKREQTFRRHYHADTGLGIGDRNALVGFPPVGLFLDTLGVRLHSPWRVHLDGFNPYPWPVTLKYRGLTVQCDEKETTVTFPNGESISITEPSPCLIDGDHKESK